MVDNILLRIVRIFPGRRRVGLLATGICLALMLGSGLQSKDPPSKNKPGVRYAWFDRGRAYSVWHVDGLVVDFSHRSSVGRMAQSPENGAQLMRTWDGGALWKIQPGGPFARSLTAGNAAGKSTSPVFSDASGIQLRALPGGIILELSPDFGEEDIQALCAAQKLSFKRRLPLSGNFIEVDSPVGMESLTKANALNGIQGVLSARPNWWLLMEVR